MELHNQIILVTGAASGMGLATALHVKALGARVVALDFNEHELQKSAEQHGFYGVAADISQAVSLEQAFHRIQSDVGVPRAVVHCAGIVDSARAVSKQGPQTLARFQKVIDVNLIGTFNVLRLSAAALMTEEPLNDDGERGVIIMTASVAAFEGQIGQLAYSASKGGVVAMTLPAAREFGPFGIRVMTIAPGIIKTPMMASLPPEVEQRLSAELPFPKRLGHAAEFAQLVQHMIENRYLNGEVIRLDAALRMAAK